MCDPATLLLAATVGLTAGGGAVSIMGQRSATKATTRQAAWQAIVADQNRDLFIKQREMATQLAEIPMLRAGLDEARARQAGDKVLSAQSAQVAANGLDPSFGSPLLMYGYSAAQIEADAQLIRSQGLIDKAAALGGVVDLSSKVLSQTYAKVGAGEKSEAAREALKYGIATTVLSSLSKMGSLFAGVGGGQTSATPTVHPGSGGGSPITGPA